MRIKFRFMYLNYFCILLIFFSTIILKNAYPNDDPWADEVVSYNAIDPNQGFNTPEKTLGEPVGGGTYAPNNSSLHSIGRPGPDPGSYIILKFNTPVTDDPQNPMGLDCIVYGNNFWVGGNPQRKWIEAGLIEISEDVNENGLADDPWYVIPGSRQLSTHILPYGIPNPNPPLAGNVLNPNIDGTEQDWGYAELTPTVQKYLDNYVRPDDPFRVGLNHRSGGGDAFDIKWAIPIDETGNPDGISQFSFIRISAFINANIPPFGYITPEIDAVADVAPDIDTDGDEILDEYEIRVAETDPNRKESTVLALEIPPEYGGSPPGTKLGSATDIFGNKITLYSKGTRSGIRDFNCTVDILTVTDPAPSVVIPEKIKSRAVRHFKSSITDFQASQVQNAEFTIAYTSTEIEGLDEPSLMPYRFNGSTFTQEEISDITKNTSLNKVTFRSQYPGIFILASTPGSGDNNVQYQDIILHATPAKGTVGTPGTSVTIYSDTIYRADNTVIENGFLFTVTTTLGVITTPDADESTPGTQVITASGIITFTLQGETLSGSSFIEVVSLDGSFYGEIIVPFLPGPPAGPADIWLLNPNAMAPGPITFFTSVIRDIFGNPVETDTHITLVCQGGIPITPDADPNLPGHQLTLNGGTASFIIRATDGEAGQMTAVTLLLYAEPEAITLIGEETFVFTVFKMPVHGKSIVIFVLLMLGGMILWKKQNIPYKFSK